MTLRIPTLSCIDVRRIDQIAADELGMPGLVLMENAGRGVADFICQQMSPGRAIVACGSGNNGGDGFVIARHLALYDWQVDVLMTVPEHSVRGDAKDNLRWLSASGVRIVPSTYLKPNHITLEDNYAVVIDALLGTGSRGALRPPLGELLTKLNQLGGLRVAVDLPSGLNGDTGEAAPETFRAHHTCTFVAAKPGLIGPQAKLYVGELQIMSIGVPRDILARFAVH